MRKRLKRPAASNKSTRKSAPTQVVVTNDGMVIESTPINENIQKAIIERLNIRQTLQARLDRLVKQ